MTENKDDLKNLYFPLFYEYLELTETLTNAEFGRLVRLLLSSVGGKLDKDEIQPKLRLPYSFMMDSAMRVFGRQKETSDRFREMANKRWEKEKGGKKKPHDNYSDTDPDEAFRLALERSFGDEA